MARFPKSGHVQVWLGDLGRIPKAAQRRGYDRLAHVGSESNDRAGGDRRICGRCRRPEQGRTTSELALADIAKLADIMIAAVDQPIRERLSAALGKERT